jgi:LisH
MAIHEYLVKHKFNQAAAILAEESGIQVSNGASGSLLKDILERKWSSVAKLKKEVDELTK